MAGIVHDIETNAGQYKSKHSGKQYAGNNGKMSQITKGNINQSPRVPEGESLNIQFPVARSADTG